MSCMTCVTNTARSLARLSRDGGGRRGGALAGTFAVAFGAAVVLPRPGAGVAAARVQDTTMNVIPTSAILSRVRPGMIAPSSAKSDTKALPPDYGFRGGSVGVHLALRPRGPTAQPSSRVANITVL